MIVDRMTQPESEPNPATLSVRLRKKVPTAFTLEVEFTVPDGITILFGPSGAGKTTLLDCVAGLARPDSGKIALGSQIVFDADQRIEVPVQSRRVGYLFQDLALFPHLTVEQNVQYGLNDLDAATRRERTAEILGSFRIAHLVKRKPGEISGGERQRVALARSLVAQPRVLLLDEPLSALDGATKSRLIEDLRAWNATHSIPILLVTHSRDEVFALGERVLLLDQGKLLAQGTPQQVLDTPYSESIAQIAGFENILGATVIAVHHEHGTMRCRVKGAAAELEVPMTRHRVGSAVRVAIRAGDIMVAATRPDGLSARNVLRGTLISLEQHGVTVIASVDAGARFEVHLTPSAREQLALETGRQIWLVIKTYSCHVVSPYAESSAPSEV